jgi:alpha/beta superfamily hydrolase
LVGVGAGAREARGRVVPDALAGPRFDLGEVAHPECEWLLAQGDADEVVPAPEVLAWAAKQPRPPRLHVLHGAGHFFHGRLHELKPLVVDFLRNPPASPGP